MNKNIELITWKSHHEDYLLNIFSNCLDLNLHGISINGSNIDFVCENFLPTPNIGLNLDSYFAFHNPDIRIIILKEYLKKYKSYIKYINFCPVFNSLSNWNIKKINEDFKNVSYTCLNNNVESRLFLDINYFDNDILYKLANLAEQNKISRLVLGSFSSQSFEINDILLNINRIKKELSIKTGIFGNITEDQIKTYGYFKDIDSGKINDIIFMKNKNISSINFDSV